jgi:hypothetical protein
MKYEYDVVFGLQAVEQRLAEGWRITMLSGFDTFHIERRIKS